MATVDAPLTESHYVPDGSGPPLRPDITVGAMLRQVAAEVPDRVALVEGIPSGGRRWTYAELLADAERCANALLDHFEPGERVGVWAHNLPEWVIVEYGAALAGLTLVTLNPSLQPNEAAYVLGQSRAAGVLVVPESRGNPIATHAEAIQPDLPELRHILRLDLLGDLMDATAARDNLPAVRGDDPAQVQYTSGTTGFPKGVVLRHHGIVDNARLWIDRVGVADGASWVSPMPLFHTGGCVLGVLGSLDRRATLTLMPGFEPGLFLELIERERAEFAAGVPTMLIAAMEHPDFATRDLSTWRGTVSGGAQVPEALVRKIEQTLGVDFTIIYGQTECSPTLTNTFPSDTSEDKGLTVGPPLPHTEVRIVDPTTLETVPIGEQGELWARGYFTMIEYFDNAEATSETLLPDGWLRTGDLATMDERGYCRIVGRLKDMIIRGGENLFPVEIEEVLMRHPAIAEVAVLGLPDDKWGEIVAAFVRLADGAETPTVAALRDFVRAELSPQKTPTKWFSVDAYPLTGSGKVQKYAIRSAWESGEFDGTELTT
ncbi:MAG: AMP-dependent synthetase [Acidimicrobiaceae bacterium]|nr:AMP-dependent synthetase [Acidimicrobiaceae bacterium]